jgi:hypothetical protein
MEGELFLAPEEIAAGETEVSQPEGTTTIASSGGDRSEGGSDGHNEESGVVLIPTFHKNKILPT